MNLWSEATGNMESTTTLPLRSMWRRQDDDAPVFTSDDATILHNENTQTVITVVAEDPDDLGAITYSLASGIFDNDLFSINSSSGVLTFEQSRFRNPNGCRSE